MDIHHTTTKLWTGLAIVALSVGLVLPSATTVKAASIEMISYVGVGIGDVIPDWTDFEPGGSREGETPTGTLVVEKTGLDTNDSAVARAMVSTSSGPKYAYDFARVGLRYTNESNHAFDIFDINFDFNLSGLLLFDSPFEESSIFGVANAGFVRNDGGAGPFTGSLVEMAGGVFPVPHNPSEFQLDAFTSSISLLRLEAGESATFVIDLEAIAAVPLSASAGFLIVSLGGLLAVGRRRASGRLPRVSASRPI